MLNIIKGRYKRLNLSIDDSGNILVKAPRFCKDNQISSFIESKRKWIEKKLNFINQIKTLKQSYDFNNYYYVNNVAFACDKEKRKKNYIEHFKIDIQPLVEELSTNTSLKFNSISYITSKRVWGCLNRNKEMKLNLIVVVLPIELTKYIIVHELCHIREFNHSKEFWKLVEKYCHNYKSLREQLKYYDFLLREDIF